MTEYDYSPEAYERYQAKQRWVSGWVQDTHRKAAPSPHSSSADESSSGTDTTSSSYTARPSHHRSHPVAGHDSRRWDDRERGRGYHGHHNVRHRSPSPYTSSSATDYRPPTPPRHHSNSYPRPHPHHMPHPSMAPRTYTHPIPPYPVYPGMPPVPYPQYTHGHPPVTPGYKVIDPRTGMPVSVVPGNAAVVLPGGSNRTFVVLPPNHHIVSPPPRHHHRTNSGGPSLFQQLRETVKGLGSSGRSHSSGGRRHRRDSH